jgi:broad specificity phosphatase PhoE
VTRQLLLVRHGITAWNAEGRFQGHRDPPLSDEGRAEARLLGERLRHDPAERPASVVSSPLLRALETAQLIAPDGEVATDRGLIEIGQGEWEGRTHAELAREDAARYSAWRTHEHALPPGAEPLEEARSRALAATRAAIAGADEAGTWPLCLVTHGGTIRLVATELLGIDLALGWRLDVDNAALCVLGEHEDGWRIERWNDVIHLLRGGHALTDDVDAQTTQRPAQNPPPRAL